MNLYLIDAYNVLHGIPDYAALLHRHAETARRSLIARCRELARNAAKVIIVFDGNGTSEAGNVRVCYSGRDTADTAIKRLIDQQPPPRRAVIVVSSDREIVQYARESGCATLSVPLFQEKLRRLRRSEDESQKSNPNLSSVDLAEWKKLFGGDP